MVVFTLKTQLSSRDLTFLLVEEIHTNPLIRQHILLDMEESVTAQVDPSRPERRWPAQRQRGEKAAKLFLTASGVIEAEGLQPGQSSNGAERTAAPSRQTQHLQPRARYGYMTYGSWPARLKASKRGQCSAIANRASSLTLDPRPLNIRRYTRPAVEQSEVAQTRTDGQQRVQRDVCDDEALRQTLDNKLLQCASMK
eukprot:scaffold29_cov178-Ochromonas_danica.AAC.4